MPQEDIQEWVDRKLQENIDEAILRDVLDDKGYSESEVQMLIENSDFNSNKNVKGRIKKYKNVLGNFSLRNPDHIGFAFLGIVIALSFIIFFSSSGSAGKCGENFQLNNIKMTDKKLYLDYDIKSDVEQTFGVANIMKSQDINMVLDELRNRKVNSTVRNYETVFETGFIPKPDYRYSTVSINFNKCGEPYKIILPHDQLGNADKGDVTICRGKCRDL